MTDHDPTGPAARRPWAFVDHTREQLSRRAREGAVLVVPVGAIEQHGPHLPVWTDTLIATEVAERAVRQVGGAPDLLVAPAVSFGSSQHHLPFGGTLSLRSTTLLDVLMDLGRSAVSSGFQRIFFVNGHGGNDELVQVAARDLALELTVHTACISWWNLVAPIVRASSLDAAQARIPGHAGAFETVVVSALLPHLVGAAPAEQPAPEAKQQRSRIEMHGAWLRADGYTDAPGSLPPADGDQILQIAVTALAEELSRFAAIADRQPLHDSPTPEEATTRD